MSSRWNRTVTTLGLNLLANVTDTRPIVITRMACASGRCATANLKDQTALTSYVMDIPITASSEVSANVYRIEGTLDNDDIQTGFYMKQVGVFAKLGTNNDEILFEIIQIQDGDSGDYIPAAAESPGFVSTQVIDLVFSTDININITVDSGSVASVKAYTDEKVADLKTYVDASDAALGGRIDTVSAAVVKAKKNELMIAACDSSAAWKSAADYVCDGNDDDEDIEAAINALPNKSGKIFIAPGTYVCDNLGGTNITAGAVQIEGIGEAVIDTNGCTLHLLGGSFEFKNLIFGADGGASGTFIRIYDSCDSVTVDNCIFKTLGVNHSDHCFGVYANTSNPPAATHRLYYTIRGCKFDGVNTVSGNYIVDSASDKLVLVMTGNYIQTAGYEGIKNTSDVKYDRVDIYGNINIKRNYYTNTATIAMGDTKITKALPSDLFDVDNFAYAADVTGVTLGSRIGSSYIDIYVSQIDTAEGQVTFSIQDAQADDITIDFRLREIPL